MNIKEIENLLETAYSRDIYEKIQQLSGEDRGKFNENLVAVLADENKKISWLSLHGLDDGCNKEIVMRILYNELFERDFSYLQRLK